MFTAMILFTLSGSWTAAVETRVAGLDETPITIRATGWARSRDGLSGTRARLMAERGAQVVASRNLLARLQDMGIEQGSRATGVLRGHRYGRTIFLENGTAMVTAEVTLTRDQARRYLRSNPAVSSLASASAPALVPLGTIASQPAELTSRPAALVP